MVNYRVYYFENKDNSTASADSALGWSGFLVLLCPGDLWLPFCTPLIEIQFWGVQLHTPESRLRRCASDLPAAGFPCRSRAGIPKTLEKVWEASVAPGPQWGPELEHHHSSTGEAPRGARAWSIRPRREHQAPAKRGKGSWMSSVHSLGPAPKNVPCQQSVLSTWWHQRRDRDSGSACRLIQHAKADIASGRNTLNFI